jgi:hypothetical protein
VIEHQLLSMALNVEGNEGVVLHLQVKVFVGHDGGCESGLF